jgi:hypothetical protein
MANDDMYFWLVAVYDHREPTRVQLIERLIVAKNVSDAIAVFCESIKPRGATAARARLVGSAKKISGRWDDIHIAIRQMESKDGERMIVT